MSQKDVGNKVPIYKLKKTEEVMKYYDEWGEGNKYDKDMVDWNYTGPKETTEVFIKYFEDKNLSCINPISWSKKNTPAFFEDSEGAMPFSSYQVSDLTKGKNRRILNLSGSTICKVGNLIIRDNKLDAFPDKAFNLHFYDYALFYGDILKNSIDRLEAYNRK